MTSLLEILKCGGCYVDFALWGSYHTRTAKQFRCRGLVVGPGNVLIEQELKGPPDFEHWSPSWDVFQCGMIAGEACIPPYLIAYHTMIKAFAITYGEKCWPLLYQQDVRFRHEEMPEILYRETKKFEASIANGTWVKGLGLDMDRPWNHCWSLLLTPEVNIWWTENFKDHTTLIIKAARTVSQFLSGDAKISGHASGHLPSAGGDAAYDGNTGGKRARISDQRKPANDKVKAKDMEACNGLTQDTAPAIPEKYVLVTITISTSAAIATVENIVLRIARRSNRRR